MPLTPGTRLGPYEVMSSLGTGGMGEVYRARDTKLNRDIAIKVLLPAVADDPERLARFSREAQLLASLNHPNIASIYGLEDDGDRTALILELVEGPTLAEIIERASSGSGLWTLGSGKHQQERSSESQEPRAKSRCGLPVEEAVAIARQIAGALEAAHEQGIIHRDLKPANIKVRADGTVKVLDFGLAKAIDEAGGATRAEGVGGELLNSPTMTSPAMTMRGMILGTAAYMAPEQAKGKAVDKRADIWAFGCVLYEMLTGRRAFGGDGVADTLAAVISREPDWSTLPPSTPPAIRRMLRRCLQKDPARRLRHIGDAAIEIEEAQADPSNKAAQADAPNQDNPPQAASRLRGRLAWTVVLALASMVAVLFASILLRRTPAAPEMRVEITTPPTSDSASFAISPDGGTIAFVATDAGGPRLWLRSLDAVAVRPLAGTDGASFPFWAPHGRSIGFFADFRLKLIDLDGGAVRELANAPLPRGGAWNRDDTIFFVPVTGPIFRLSAEGGEPMAVTRIEAGQSTHSFPQFLADGDHFVYYVSGSPDVRGVYGAALDATGARRLVDADSMGVSTTLGYLLFVRSGTLFAQPLDPERLELTGTLFPVAQEIALQPLASRQVATVSASTAGRIIYRTGSTSQYRQFVWFDRSGQEIAKVASPDAGVPLSPAISESGRRVAFHRTVDGNTDIWLLETDRGGLSRFTSNPANEIYPLWSPDGSRIVFTSNRNGSYELFEKSTLGTLEEKVLLPLQGQATDWSRDGRFLLFQRRDLKTNSDIWVLPYGTDQKPFPLVQTDFDERDAQFSPDGRWIAYQSVESGRSEIHVQPFPGPGSRTPISINGGAQPRWRSDGKELFFIALDERLMAVPISLPSSGGSVEVGAPVTLFATRVGGAVQNASRQQYIVSPDGARFLMNTVLEGPAASPITLILNWKPRPPASRE